MKNLGWLVGLLVVACGGSGGSSGGAGGTSSGGGGSAASSMGGSTSSSRGGGGMSSSAGGDSTTSAGGAGGASSTGGAGQGGAGTGGGDLCAKVTCKKSDDCHVAGTCDPQTGTCSNPKASDGTTCSDGNACTINESCQSGACQGGVPITAADGTIDQSQLQAIDDGWNVYPAIGIGQEFTVGRSGILTGIEISFDATGIPSGNFELDVYDSTNTLLGSSQIAAAGFTSTASQLSATVIGPGFFDFSGQCIAVTSGDVMRFELTEPGISAGTCSGTPTGNCVGGPYAGSVCDGDANCCYPVFINATQPSTYDGGQIMFNTVPGSSDDDLEFKTFVK